MSRPVRASGRPGCGRLDLKIDAQAIGRRRRDGAAERLRHLRLLDRLPDHIGPARPFAQRCL